MKHKDFSHFCKTQFRCEYVIVTEQKARTTYEHILRLSDDPDVNDVIRFLREREVVHFQRFGDALRKVQDMLDKKNYYAFTPTKTVVCPRDKRR